MNFKKISLFVLVVLSIQNSITAADRAFNPRYSLPRNIDNRALRPSNTVGETVIGAVALFGGVYVLNRISRGIPYLYYMREASIQECNPSMNHNVINELKNKCLEKGVIVDHIYYDPEFFSIRGDAEIMETPLGVLLFLGAGYGASSNEKDILLLSPERVEFIIGRECSRVLYNHSQKRDALNSALAASGLGILSILVSPKLDRVQKYNADYYASTDAQVIASGAEHFEATYSREQYKDIIQRCMKYIKDSLFFIDYSPSAKNRYLELKMRAQELKRNKQVL
ncbi:MAG: hypothetical protein ACJAZS_000020 [Alteromonas naphthalenivorans]